jgi:hypothetical protein
MSESADDVPDETIFVADSVDEFVERTRHKQLLEAKETAADALRKSPQVRAQAGERAARESVRRAVEGFVLEAESLFRRTDEGRTLWREPQIDTVPLTDVVELGETLESGEDFEGVADARAKGDIRTRQAGGQWVVDVIGVAQYFELQESRIEVTYDVAMNRRGGPTSQRTTTARPSTPIDTSREVFRATNALLDALDLGVRMSADDSGTVESDYSSLLDELTDE